MISKEQVQHIAKLARITLSDEETAQFQQELSHVLEYFSMLDKVDVSSVEPTVAGANASRTEREDRAVAVEDATYRILTEAIPESQDGFVKVRAVFHHGI
ncbi:MAG: Asp-tRNA(Asn)/Glu-tRNA(Gln) amidotransferase subunit GatC [Candidatus Wildermuthbacteria bacterium]|nr:Asp-tRNA(Asn)/Glu-tRNA(Gln) amidotransferase subunit GatC [Candidatus Wildermuthbacteria bacterium]